MLRGSLSRYLLTHHDFDERQSIVQSSDGFSPTLWQAFAQELGILGAPFSEADGGLGGGAVEHMVVMEEIGRALCAQPYLSTVIMGGGLLKATGTHQLIPAIVSGDARIAFAFAEKDGRYDLRHVKTTARRQDNSYIISGHKAVVRDAPSATHIIFVARTSGGTRDAEGVSLFLMPANTSGVVYRHYPLVDGARASEVFFENTLLSSDTRIGPEGAALPIIEKIIDEATAAVCAEASGILSEMHRQTLEYAKQRKQFGRAIADFQVLQHAMVNMYIEVEQAQSMALMATLKLGADPVGRACAVSAAKSRIGKALKFCGQTAIQIHGGMGVTEELAIGQYFMRGTMIESQFGSVDHHLGRYEALMLAG